MVLLSVHFKNRTSLLDYTLKYFVNKTIISCIFARLQDMLYFVICAFILHKYWIAEFYLAYIQIFNYRICFVGFDELFYGSTVYILGMKSPSCFSSTQIIRYLSHNHKL